MSNLQKMGGIAALIAATAYLVGIVLFLVILDPGGPLDPVERVAFLAEKETITYIAMLFIYVVSGFILVVLVQALHERLKIGSPAMMQTAAVFGYIWAGILIAGGMIFLVGLNTVVELYDKDPAQAASAWLAVGIVFEGLGGGIETVGGLWTLLISWAALRSGEFPRVLNYLGMVVGVAGIVTIVPALEDLTIVFGLGQIPWFVWLGSILLRSNQN
jgi:hypothetical protein